MIRRFFLRFLAVSPLAGLAALHPARGEIGARAAGPAGAPADYPGRIELTARMVEVHRLRRLIDAGERELNAIQAKYDGIPSTDPMWAGCFAKSHPIYMRMEALEDHLQELEREPIDCLLGDPAVCPGGALWLARGAA